MGKPSFNTMVIFGATMGLVSGLFGPQLMLDSAVIVSELFIRLLRLVSAPIIFFALVSTLTGMKSLSNARKLAGMVLKYTLLTTLIAASIALVLFLVIDPVKGVAPISGTSDLPVTGSYSQYLLSLIPSSFIAPFVDNQVVSVLILASLFSVSILSLPESKRTILHELFDSLFAAVMRMTSLILYLLPLAVWAFVTDFCRNLEDQQMLTAISLYVLCVPTRQFNSSHHRIAWAITLQRSPAMANLSRYIAHTDGCFFFQIVQRCPPLCDGECRKESRYRQ